MQTKYMTGSEQITIFVVVVTYAAGPGTAAVLPPGARDINGAPVRRGEQGQQQQGQQGAPSSPQQGQQ